MDLTTIMVLVLAVVAFLLFKRAGLIGAASARDLVRQGAKVIDVRSPAEFARGHLPGAENIPWNEVDQQFPGRHPDKEKPYLLHCLSGGRSMMAKRALRRLGYTRVHNLGSYGRAARLTAKS